MTEQILAAQNSLLKFNIYNYLWSQVNLFCIDNTNIFIIIKVIASIRKLMKQKSPRLTGYHQNKNAVRPEEVKTNALIQLRCRSRDKEKWQGIATAKGLSLSAWIIEILNNADN
jgi:predicted HicB family RNase H-like nuclease